MKKIKVSIEEQETTYNIFPKQASTPCEIYSCIPSEVAKIKRYAEQYPDEVVIIKEDQIGIFAQAPANWFNFKPPIRRKMTVEQKKAIAERLNAARKAKQE